MTTNFPKPLDKQVADISGSLSQTQDGLAIVANGNTHAAISSGQFVYVKNHDTLAEGLHKATSAIAANGTLSTSNLTPDGSGGLNDLQAQLTTLNSKLKYGRWEAITLPYNVPSDGFISVYLNPSTTAGAYVRIASGGGNPSITAVATSGEPVTCISPVRRNDYFSQQLLTNGTITCRFMPIFQE